MFWRRWLWLNLTIVWVIANNDTGMTMELMDCLRGRPCPKNPNMPV